MRLAPSIVIVLIFAAQAASPEHVSGIEQPILAAHNAVRSRVHVAPLSWSKAIADIARKRADQILSTGKFAHLPHWRYGENLFEAEGETATPQEVVDEWAAEARDYDYKFNACHGTCGHYTQIVWRTTEQVGCAASRAGNLEVFACEYDPPGNYIGQRPY
jgi:pathogenesis-related protein 1